MHSKVRSLAAGGLVVAGTVVAACGAGSGGGRIGASAGPTTSTTGAAPTTTSAVAADPELIVRSADGAIDYTGREPSTIGFSGDATNIVSHLTWGT